MLRPLSFHALAALCVAILPAFCAPRTANAQAEDRIRFNDQDLFLSGSNVAWINFARDIGPGATDLNRFRDMFQELHAHGGNAMRLWLHTTGAATPEWDGNRVVGPGAGAIDDLRAILDLAWEHEIGLMLCLWSFDMLRISNGTTITDRSYALLSDSALTQTYIDNALVPMVDSLAGHPAIVAWEIFNEPEGMSNEHGWNFNRHVPMADIQRFINQTAGAIHRADPEALVTNGSWAFIASSDATPTETAAKTRDQLTAAELAHVRESLTGKYRHPFTTAEAKAFYEALHGAANYNYYTDERLVAAGGDTDGTLDFYTVHYYEWAGTALSPFHHDAAVWGLAKPLAITEFFMGGGDDGNPDATFSVPYEDLYVTLFDRGYAGAMGWQWFNYPTSAEGVVNWPRMLENTETLFALYPDDVDVSPGLRIAYFRADPPGIEAGQESLLSWSVSGASSVTLDGAAVDSVGTQAVSPAETTTYALEVTGRDDGTVLTEHVTVTVLDPDEVNRARLQPAVASTIERCCGPARGPERAVDGDPGTRWSSAWQEGEADEDPDDEWIYVDLGAAYDLHRVVLRWEVAYGSAYDLDVSYDGHVWTTVFEERSGDGETDEVAFAVPPSARYVRVHCVARGTAYGYSLWEFEVYGLPSAKQPPTVTFTAPAEGAVLAPASTVTLTAEAADPDGTVQQVDFYVDGALVGTVNAAPFSVSWPDAPAGEHAVVAVVTDGDGIAVSSGPLPVFVTTTDGFARYEAEGATYAGDITAQNAPAASGGSYLDLRDSGTIAFNDVSVARAGTYLLTLGYNLAYDVPKHQYLVVNGDTVADLRFNGIRNTWLQRGLKVPLQQGANTIAIEKFWGWMYVDYLSVSADVVNVAVDDGEALPEASVLGANYPNPFNPETVIPYALPEATPVQIDVFDLMGRRVAVLVDGVQPAGRYAVRFDGRGLASGVYVYRLRAGAVVQTQRMVLMK